MSATVWQDRDASFRARTSVIPGRRELGLGVALLLALAAGVVGLRTLIGVPNAPGPARAGSLASPWAKLPPAARLAVSRGLGGDDSAYWGGHHSGTLTLANPAQGLAARFEAAGVAVSASGQSFSMSLSGGGTLAAPELRRNVVRYHRGSVTEWYANGPLGIEQGFRIARAQAAPLRLQIGGSLRPRLQPGATGLDLVSASGATVLRYSGLRVTDARGRALPARLSLRGRELQIGFSATHARYPLTVDPLVQAAKLTNSDGYAGEGIAGAVAISGNTIAVGAPSANVSGATSTNLQGAVYVFTAPGGNWAAASQVAELVASNPDPGGNSSSNVYGDTLGASVAIDGATIVAGAPRASDATPTAFVGAAYVFQEPAGGWQNATQSAELLGTGAQQYDDVGASVAVSGTTVAVGALNVGSGDQHSIGKIYVFTQPAGGWSGGGAVGSTATLTDSAASSSLGFSLAADGGSTIVAGAPYATEGSNTQQGQVDVYVEPPTGWGTTNTPTARLTRSTGAAQEWLGFSVGISGATIVAGAPHAPGAVSSPLYVYTRTGPAWTSSGTPAATLTASDHAVLGATVGISGTTIVAGNEFVTTSPGHYQGALYVFNEPAGGWATGTESQKLTAADPGSADLELGASVGVSGSGIVAGAPLANAGGHANQGAAFVFSSGAGTSTSSTSATSTTAVSSSTVTFSHVTTKVISQTATSTAPFIPLPLNVPIGGVIACSGNSCTINIGCPYSTAPQCAGSISVGSGISGTAPDLGSAARAKHRAKRRARAVVLASGRFVIARGHNGRVRLVLTRAGRAALKKRRSVSTSFVETITKPRRRTVHGRITLRRTGR